MSRNNYIVRSVIALGAVFLLCVFLLPLNCIAVQPAKSMLSAQKLIYVVEPLFQGETARLLVSLTFQGEPSGKTRLLLPLEWSHGVELYRAIRNIRSLSEDVRVEDTMEPHVKTVHHRPNQRVSLTYEVITQPPSTKLTIAVYHYPVLRSSYFYVIGQALWVYPDMPETTPLRVTLHWKNIPNGWMLINSFGASEPRQKVNTTLEKFRAGTFLAGDYRVKRIVMNGHPIYAVTRGQWVGGADEKLNSFLQKLLQVMRDFWNSYDYPYYLVALLPLPEQSEVRGGEARTNSFSLYLPNDLITLSHQRVLAHELFHAWNPQRLGSYENDRLYWFGEGFTDYYAFLLLLRAGLISLDEYVALHNSWIEAYYTSPVRSLTVDEMVQKRQTNHDAEELFYKKGYLLANHLDFTIRSKTNGKHSLDDVMRSLLRLSKPGSIKLSEKRIADALRPYLQEQGASDIEKYMNRGELVPADNSFGACATVEDIEYRSFDLGFDFEKSSKTRVVSGVVPDSNAHKAGLRDGQKLVTWGFMLDNPKRQAKITIVESATQKVLQYYPASTEAIRLPQFKLKPNLSSEEHTQCLSQFGVSLAHPKTR
jgi:predicted metalloprotease with PDZ domain